MWPEVETVRHGIPARFEIRFIVVNDRPGQCPTWITFPLLTFQEHLPILCHAGDPVCSAGIVHREEQLLRIADFVRCDMVVEWNADFLFVDDPLRQLQERLVQESILPNNRVAGCIRRQMHLRLPQSFAAKLPVGDPGALCFTRAIALEAAPLLTWSLEFDVSVVDRWGFVRQEQRQLVTRRFALAKGQLPKSIQHRAGVTVNAHQIQANSLIVEVRTKIRLESSSRPHSVARSKISLKFHFYIPLHEMGGLLRDWPPQKVVYRTGPWEDRTDRVFSRAEQVHTECAG